MNERMEVVLVLLPVADAARRIGRLIATLSVAHGDGPWSAESSLYQCARTGEIARAAMVVSADTPLAIRNRLEHALMQAWHHGGDVHIVDVSGRPLEPAEVARVLRRMMRPSPALRPVPIR